ncbi:DUF6048 family protein [Pseudotenacibaculum haliotis]|uniref:DUF6048 family protein n=1 Tax=Pseudotenacibaculum haliotis TaxID=1862138 RepID=A0ABW5LV14_9FLAO
MYKYFISLLLVLACVNVYAQQADETQKDTIVYKTNYGLRLGVDISKPIRGMLQSDYKGFEFVGDYRISKKWYIASEIGFEEKTTQEDFTNSTAKGNYIRLGVNYNSYKNWLDMNNEIYLGFRYGFATFEQTLNSYEINTGNPVFDSQTITTPITTTGLNAHWTEIMVGIKAEVYNNIFVGISGSYKIMVSVQDPPNFKTHFAPGFNRVYASNTGFGFNYTISYLIPFSKK